jgi:acetyl-CoA carboxylase biotin carboxyl carrier protein
LTKEHAVPNEPKKPMSYNFTYQDAVEVLRLIRESEGVTSFELEFGDIKLSIDRRTAPGRHATAPVEAAAPQASAAIAEVPAPARPARPAAAPASAEADELHRVVAPMLGIFFRSPAAGQPPFVKEGDEVKSGDTVGLIEVMKLFSPVLAGCAGRVVRIEAADATLVEHGQTLLLIERSTDA